MISVTKPVLIFQMFLVVLLGCLCLSTLALPVKDSERINSMQLSSTLAPNRNGTNIDQSTIIPITESTVDVQQENHDDKSTTLAPRANSIGILSTDSTYDIQKNSTTDDEPSPTAISTRLPATLLKILVMMG